MHSPGQSHTINELQMTSGLLLTLSSDLDRLDGSNEFQDFANQLTEFPQNINSRVKFELGGKESPWASYLLFEVYCYDPTERSAIKVVMESHFMEAYCDKSEFFICCYPAAIDNLGKLLRE
jgi:hypothetical protein